MEITCEGTIGWQREFLNLSRKVHFLPIEFDEPLTSLSFEESGRNILIGGIDFLFTLYQKYSVELDYTFDWSRNYQDNFFYLGFTAQF